MPHEWKKDEFSPEKPDIFAYQAGEYCNGPECVKCGLSFCHHCHPERYETECEADKTKVN